MSEPSLNRLKAYQEARETYVEKMKYELGIQPFIYMVLLAIPVLFVLLVVLPALGVTASWLVWATLAALFNVAAIVGIASLTVVSHYRKCLSKAAIAVAREAVESELPYDGIEYTTRDKDGRISGDTCSAVVVTIAGLTFYYAIEENVYCFYNGPLAFGGFPSLVDAVNLQANIKSTSLEEIVAQLQPKSVNSQSSPR